MNIYWPDKDPDENKDYVIDWTLDLNGDTIDTSTWIVPSGLVQGSESKTSNQTKIWLSGGVEGKKYRVINRIVTSAGRTEEHTAILEVRSFQIVTLQEVKNLLLIDTDDDDSMLTLLLKGSTRRILAYLKSGVDYFKDSNGAFIYEEIPEEVKIAIIMLVGYLYRNPDKDPDRDFGHGQLPHNVTALVYMLRDPALR